MIFVGKCKNNFKATLNWNMYDTFTKVDTSKYIIWFLGQMLKKNLSQKLYYIFTKCNFGIHIKNSTFICLSIKLEPSKQQHM